ncbi:hypothetical protein FOL47_000632 [Perkinsus chesapeaki]|uniref:Reverse transcriptase domain-containing protein n=1 Tax=Perkinsus chesapeaki TaxID=330153 RepID=A0A7J6KW32_PERCH|nr:hypothetical protein FOL47_000632 [Perkinsus chesapeaki]
MPAPGFNAAGSSDSSQAESTPDTFIITHTSSATEDVDGSMLLQFTDIADIKELMPKIEARTAVLLVAKIKAWRYKPTQPTPTNPRPTPTRSRSRSRSPRRTLPPTRDDRDALQTFFDDLLEGKGKIDDQTLERKILDKLKENKDTFGTPGGELLPPKQVLDELFKAKDAGKNGRNGPTFPYITLEKFSPPDPTLPLYDDRLHDCGNMVPRRRPQLPKQCAPEGSHASWMTKLARPMVTKYDAVVRATWESRSLADPDFNLTKQVARLDVETLLTMRNEAENPSKGNQNCFAFERGGPSACRNQNCPYKHRCAICRSGSHGTRQHENGYTNSTNTRPNNAESRNTNNTTNVNKGQATNNGLEMLDHIDHPDHSLVTDLVSGMRVTGTIGTNHLFPTTVDKHPTDKATFLSNASATRQALQDLHYDYEEDTAPRTIYRGLHAPQTPARLGLLPEIPKVEPDKTREIDDMTISGVNSLVSVPEKVTLDHIDDLVEALFHFRRGEQARGLQRRYLVYKGDHAHAYRQVCTSPLDRDVLAVRLRNPEDGKYYYFEHACLAFGHRASLLRYSRVARAIVNILRHIFDMVAFVYVDDFFVVCAEDEATLCYNIFQQLNQWLGFATKDTKAMKPTDSLKLLGLQVEVQNDKVTLDIDQQRRVSLRQTLTDTLCKARLTPSQASKLAGKLGFVSTVFNGKNGRAYLRALYNRVSTQPRDLQGKRMANFSANSDVAVALDWFLWALEHCPRRQISLHNQNPHVIMYTDAEFSKRETPSRMQKHACIGSVIAIPDHQRVFYFSWEPPADIFDLLEPRGNDIHPLEALAVPVALHHWLNTNVPFGLLNRRTGACNVTLYIDSTVAEGTIRKGSSPCPDLNAIAKHTWKIAAAHSVGLWTTTVASASNPADLPSRGRYEEMTHLCWTKSEAEPDPPWRSWLARR